MINTTLGPCASKDYPFNVTKLEQQALKYLKLENDQGPASKNIHLQLIVAACCFLQYSQTKEEEIKISDVDRQCKKLNIRSGKALSFLDKWESTIKEEKSIEEVTKSLNCTEEISKKSVEVP